MYELIKRIIDLILTIAVLILLAPLLLLIIIFIKLESAGPVIDKQVRLGKNSRQFRLYMFRTMYVAELSQGKEGFTKVGSFLRQTSLNELPSLINVLRGDMSLVGPRPALPYEVERYEAWQKERLICTPGMTGYWQVYGKEDTFQEMAKLDIEYIHKRSVWLDILILLRTPLVVFTKSG